MAYISNVQEILEYADISQIIEHFRGSDYIKKNKCCCLFHEEKTPSMHYYENSNTVHCFGSCGKTWNVASLVMDEKQLSYYEAVKWIAEHFNITIKYEDEDDTTKQQRIEKEDRTSKLKQKIQDSQQKALAAMASRPDALEYLSKRGYTPATIAELGIGYWEGKNKDDIWSNRITFPIHNTKGDIVAFGARTLDKTTRENPKYINSTDSEIFEKKRTLYGLHRAKKAIKKHNKVYVVEGYTDADLMYQESWINTIATCGTAFTEQHAQIIARYTPNVVFIFDGDEAGRKAAKKAIEIGIRNQLNVQICIIAEGKDPADLLYTKSTYPKYSQWKQKQFINFIESRNQLREQLAMLEVLNSSQLGINYLVSEAYPEDKDTFALLQLESYVALLLSSIEAENIRQKLTKEICTEFKFNKADLTKAVKKIIDEKLEAERTGKIKRTDQQRFDIENYGFYEEANKYFFTSSATYSGSAKSNFILIPDMFIQDQKRVMEIVNDAGVRKQVEFAIEDMINLSKFKRVLEGMGNFRFMGSDSDLGKIKAKLFEKEKFCIEPNFLGWNEEHQAYIMSNGIIKDGVFHPVDEQKNIVKIQNKTYLYLPYFSKSVDKNMVVDERKFRYISTDVSFEEYTQLFLTNYQNNGMIGLMYLMCLVHSTEVFKSLNESMPMLFSYGQPETGKTQMAKSMLSWFGERQFPIDLCGDSTPKGINATMSKFCDATLLLDEYKNITAEQKRHTGLLRATYNRNPNRNKAYSNNNRTVVFPMRSQVLVCGTQLPTIHEDLYTRFIILRFNKREFNKSAFNKMRDYETDGIVHLLAQVLKYRPAVQQLFRKEFRKEQEKHIKLVEDGILKSRTSDYLCMLLSMYNVLSPYLAFPFTYEKLQKFTIEILSLQQKDFGGSIDLGRFWLCFESAVKDKNNTLETPYDYKIVEADWEGEAKTLLKFKFTNIFPQYGPRYKSMFGAGALDDKSLRHYLKNDEAFLAANHQTRFGTGKPTTAYVYDYGKLQERGIDLAPKAHIEDFGQKPDYEDIIAQLKNENEDLAARFQAFIKDSKNQQKQIPFQKKP